MANAKKAETFITTGSTVYVIIDRKSDGYLLNDADGAFASAPADPYVSMTEHTTIKGRYEKSESRTVWTDGQYGWTAYKQTGGSPSPVADTVIGAGIMTVVSDIEVDNLADKTVDLVWDEVLTGATHNVATSAGRRLRQLGAQAVASGTAQGYEAGTVNTIQIAAADTAPSRLYDECLIVIDGGTALGEGHHILSYNTTTKIAVLDDDWITLPDATSTYQIYASSAFDATTGRAAGGSANTITLNGDAVATNDYYNSQVCYIASGTGKGQARKITDFVGSTKIATVVPPWIVTPDANSAYMIFPIAASFIESWITNRLVKTTAGGIDTWALWNDADTGAMLTWSWNGTTTTRSKAA